MAEKTQANGQNGRWYPPVADREDQVEYYPSPEVIRRECERIRSSWSAGELERRRCHGCNRIEYTVPEIPIGQCHPTAEHIVAGYRQYDGRMMGE